MPECKYPTWIIKNDVNHSKEITNESNVHSNSFYTLNYYTHLQLAWHSEVCASLQQILSFVVRIFTVQHVELRSTPLWRVGGNGRSIESTVSDAIVRSCCGRLQLRAPHWATSVALLQVANNWTHIVWLWILYNEAPGHRRLYLSNTYTHALNFRYNLWQTSLYTFVI